MALKKVAAVKIRPSRLSKLALHYRKRFKRPVPAGVFKGVSFGDLKSQDVESRISWALKSNRADREWSQEYETALQTPAESRTITQMLDATEE